MLAFNGVIGLILKPDQGRLATRHLAAPRDEVAVRFKLEACV
jgi:hypothetical protein